GDRRGRVLGGHGGRRTIGHDDIYLETDQLGREVREPRVLSFCPAVLQDEVLAFDIAERAHPLQESPYIWVSSWGSLKKHTTPVHSRRLLRLGSERRHEQTQGECDDASEGATPHSHFLQSASCRPSPCHRRRTLAVSRAQEPQRRRSEGC